MYTYSHFSDAPMHSLTFDRIDAVPSALVPFYEAIPTMPTAFRAAAHFFVANSMFLLPPESNARRIVGKLSFNSINL